MYYYYVSFILGNHCETNINDCIHDPCVNNGTCIDEIQDYSCKCYAGFTGKSKIIKKFEEKK